MTDLDVLRAMLAAATDPAASRQRAKELVSSSLQVVALALEVRGGSSAAFAAPLRDLRAALDALLPRDFGNH